MTLDGFAYLTLEQVADVLAAARRKDQEAAGLIPDGRRQDPHGLAIQCRTGRLAARKVGAIWLVEPAEAERYGREQAGRPGRKASRGKK